MAALIQTAGADRVLTLDLHSPQIQGFFSMPADQITAVPLLCDHLKKQDLSHTVVGAADRGETQDAGRFAKRPDLPLAGDGQPAPRGRQPPPPRALPRA